MSEAKVAPCLSSEFKDSSIDSLMATIAPNTASRMPQPGIGGPRAVSDAFDYFNDECLPSLSDLNITDLSISHQGCMQETNVPQCSGGFFLSASQFLLTDSRPMDQNTLSKFQNDNVDDPLYSIFGCLSEPFTPQLPSLASKPIYSNVACCNIESDNCPLSLSDLDLTDKSASLAQGVFSSVCSPEIRHANWIDSDRHPPSLSDLNLTDLPTCLSPMPPQNGCSNFVIGTSATNAVDVCSPPCPENEPTEPVQLEAQCLDAPIPSGRKHQWYTCGKNICCHLRNEHSGSLLWFLECTRPSIGGCHGCCKLRPKYVPPRENSGKSYNR